MVKKILSYAGKYKKITYQSVVVMLLGISMNVLPFMFIYQLIAPLIDNVTISVEYVIWRVLGIAVCVVLYSILFTGGLELSHQAAYNILKNLRISLQGKMEKQPLGTIQEMGVGSIKKMFIDDIESIELLLAHAIPEGIANLAVPIIAFIAMFFVDWKLALLALCALPIGIIAIGIMVKKGTSKMEKYYKSAQKINNTIVEYINGMEVVKIFNRDGESYRRFENDVVSYRDFTLDWYRACWPSMAVYNTILPCMAFFVLPIGTFLVYSGYSDLTDFVLILCMCFAVGGPLLRAVSFAGKLPQVAYKIEELEKIMSAHPLIQSEKAFSGKDHSISFENVRFGYNDTEVIHGIDLFIKEGTLTALVGESGSGKSTLAKLLVHFYDYSGGSIKIGGHDIQQMSVESLNNEISYVSQEQFLFNTTLLENIRVGRPDASDREVIEAADKAQCTEFFSRLEKGIYTMAGDGGKQLSGGERQRISLARAILKDAPIIVLDEATAFIDPENEEKMNEAITEIIRGKTVIVIAHRLHTIVDADQICVLNAGEISAVGTHEKLLESSNDYCKLWRAAENSAQWEVSIGKGVKKND